uniref:Ubiquinone biosynthesis O-methyltransferase, mitochondrial n=1 Tax=Timema douglasi TaxID=61478 RepID=A0A7R8VBT3_TIMDO|nr:unnamed protein product [Timema douglasi]
MLTTTARLLIQTSSFPKVLFRSIAAGSHSDVVHLSQSTVDEDDVGNYSKLSDRWWDEGGEMRALHTMNTLRIYFYSIVCRVPFIRDGLISSGQTNPSFNETNHPLEGLKILEVGCGGGILTEPLARLGAEVTGVDASDSMIETAQLHANKDPEIASRLTYIHSTIEEHTSTHHEFYNAVIASEVLEHVTEKNLFVEACSSALKPSGSFFVTTLNRTMLTWVGGILLAEYVLRLLPQGTHDYNKCIHPHETQSLLSKHGCNTVLVHGMCYNFLSNQWKWSNNTVINYAVHTIKTKQT